MEWFGSLGRGTKIALLGIVAVALLGCCLLTSYGYANSVRQEGIRQERALGAQYLDNQNELSAYISSFYEQIGVANLKSEKMDQILLDAVKGRYDEEGFGANGAFFAAIREAYPDLKGLDIYDKIVDFIRAGREAYKNKQSKLLDMLRAYDTWREEDILRSFAVRLLGFPSRSLEARVGDAVYTGLEARRKMYQIVLTSDTLKAYDTGIMEPLSPKR